MTTINDKIQDLSEAFQDFSSCIDRIPTDQREQPGVCGSWSAKDVIAHLIGWDMALTRFINAPQTFDPEPLYDVNTFNDQSVAKHKKSDWGDVKSTQQRAFAELIDALNRVLPDDRIYPRVDGWLSGRIEDYRLHRDQIKSWLA